MFDHVLRIGLGAAASLLAVSALAFLVVTLMPADPVEIAIRAEAYRGIEGGWLHCRQANHLLLGQRSVVGLDVGAVGERLLGGRGGLGGGAQRH